MQLFENLYAFLWQDSTTNNCNTYFINGPKRILIDPGHYHLIGHVSDHLSRLDLSPEEIDVIITLHGHPDHMESVKYFSELPSLVGVPKQELDFVKTQAPHYWEAMGLEDFEPDFMLQEGDLQIGDLRFRIIHTPGHSPGSLCMYWPDKKVLFTSDVVFNQGVGRTDLPGGNGKDLKESIRSISLLESDYLLPGHGDLISGSERIRDNFKNIEKVWFAYL